MISDLIDRTIKEIVPLDEAAMDAARARQDQLTKPLGSLGRLEELSIRLAGIFGEATPKIRKKTVILAAGDHGVVAEGVSAYPQDVTPAMVMNFLGGGAAINALANHAGADIVVLDVGVVADLPDHPSLRSVKVGRGTDNIAVKGKGKTTAALGVTLRSWGRGMKVIVLQFIKHSTANFGEQRAALKMGVEMRAMGDGFTWRSKDLDQSADLARAHWEDCKKVIESGEYDLIVLDEFTYPMHYGWVDTEEVIEVLKSRPDMLHVIITGRNAPEALVEYADLVTEMNVIKHPYQQGIKAQPGIEF